jgi:hypothetical protein
LLVTSPPDPPDPIEDPVEPTKQPESHAWGAPAGLPQKGHRRIAWSVAPIGIVIMIAAAAFLLRDLTQRPEQSDAGSTVVADGSASRELDVMVMGVNGPIDLADAQAAIKGQFTHTLGRCIAGAHLGGFSFVYRITIQPTGDATGSPTMISVGSQAAFRCADAATRSLTVMGQPPRPASTATIDVDLTLAAKSR